MYDKNHILWSTFWLCSVVFCNICAGIIDNPGDEYCENIICKYDNLALLSDNLVLHTVGKIL